MDDFDATRSATPAAVSVVVVAAAAAAAAATAATAATAAAFIQTRTALFQPLCGALAGIEE